MPRFLTLTALLVGLAPVAAPARAAGGGRLTAALDNARYDLGEVSGSSANKAWSLQGQCRAGPVNALLGYFKSNAPRDIATANDTVKILTAAASYNFGGFQPLVMFQSAKSSLAPVALDRYNVNLGLDIFLAADLLRFEV